MQPLSPDLPGEDGQHLLPEVRYHEGLANSPISAGDPTDSSPSTFCSTSNFAEAPTPIQASVTIPRSSSNNNSKSDAETSLLNAASVVPSLSPRHTTSNTIAAVISLPASPTRSPLQHASSFISTPGLKGTNTESVKFVGKHGATTDGEQQRGFRGGGGNGAAGGPTRLLCGMQGTVLPEHHGGLPKMGHTAVSYQQAIYVFGGVNGKGQYSNHVFCHEKHSLAWHEIRGVGVVPRGRANHAAVLIDSKIYIFGGHRQLEVFDDLFAYDIVTSRWEKISYEQSQGPGGVFLHCMIHIPSSENLLVLGGMHHNEQNSYLGHLFDIRNRVWSGVPPPPAVNPQHLQLVTAAYHEPSSSVVILGLAEDHVDDAVQQQSNCVPAPYVYVFYPQSFSWRRIETPTAPESPLPFRVETLWEHFLHLLTTSGGGLYDPVLQDWMFPFPFPPSPGTATGNTHRKSCQNSLTPPPPPANKLGFLVLSLREMSWSLVLCKFPRKLLAEVKTYNAAEQQRSERSLSRAGGVAGSTLSAALYHRSSSSTRANRKESGVLSVSVLSRAPGAGGGGNGGVFGQRPQQRNLSMSSYAGVTWGGGDNSGETSGGSLLNAGADRYRRLVNFQDAPEFMRKFVLVAVRDAPLRNGRLRPMQYMVLHGGLVEPTDYTMLAFKPKLTRIDALAATKQNGQLAGLVRTASYRTMRGTCNTTTGNGDVDSDDTDNDETSYRAFPPTADTESFNELFSAGNGGGSGAQKKFGAGDANSTSYVPVDDGDAFSQTFGNSVSDENIGLNFGGFDGGAQLPHLSSLLPTLPSGRTTVGSRHRFALQYTPQNALHTESVLPYANIPVAVLESAEDVCKWSKSYYADQRKWLSEKLKDALIEDRKLRRFRRPANMRSGRPVSSGGSGARSSRASGMSDDLSIGDTDSLMESLYLLESLTNLPRGGQTGEKKRSTIQAIEDQLAMEAAAAAVENSEAPKRRVRDFFEERHLEPFVAEDAAQLPHLSCNASTSSDDRGKKGKKSMKGAGTSASVGIAKAKKTKTVPVTATTSSGKKHGAKSTITTVAVPHTSAASSASGAAPLPTSFMPIVSQSIAASVGFERLTMKPKRRMGAGRRLSGAFPSGCSCGGGGDFGYGDLAHNVLQVLLQNGLDRLRADDDSTETRRKKARLRWRFLRALVCTGAASYLMYLTSQSQSKMKGVTVSSTPGLVLAPELHLVGPSQAYKVPSKPVPYNVSYMAGPIPAPPSMSSARFTQVTNSGMVVYRSLR